MALTIFYDGLCPLCAKEMNYLKRNNKNGALKFVDITHEDFSKYYPELDFKALNERIHAMQDNGKMLIGLDALHKAWQLIGKGWLYAPSRLPVIRWIADRVYVMFARHRYRISYWLTGEKRCDVNCETKLK